MIINTLFFGIMLLLLIQHLVIRQINWVIFLRWFILNLIVILTFPVISWRFSYVILSLLGRHCIDIICPLCLSNNRQCMAVFSGKGSFSYCKDTYVSGYSLWCFGVGSLCGWCFPGIHHAGWWLGQSFYPSQTLLFSIHHYYSSAPGLCSVGCPGPVWVVVRKCQILTYIQSYRYVWLSGHSSPQYQANSAQIVCVILALDSWNYCSGEQGLIAKRPILTVGPYSFIE